MTENLKKLRAEKDDAEKKLAQAQHELNRIEQVIHHTSKRARNQRTYHLIYMRLLASRRQKYAPELLRLVDELIT